MLQFLLGVFLFFLAIQILWRIFAPALTRSVLKYTVGKMQEDFIKQENAWQESYESEFERTITLTNDLKVKVPHRSDANRKTKNIRYVDES
jgi:hypothetical protein